MDFIMDIQKAIDYMEEHLLEPITYKDVAKHIYISNYHFHRTFSLLTGMTATDYIRKRRLSLAGDEITMTRIKVTDLALKYGYQTSESFTKAFTRFHGIAPNLARCAGTNLKSFNRLHIKITLEGGKGMDYRIEKREPFTLLAKITQFRNEIISEEDNQEIPDFWKTCRVNGTLNVLKKHSLTSHLFGLCAPISKESSHFDYGIGMEYKGQEIPEGYGLWEVKPELWAVFKCIGTDPVCIGDTWKRIFSEFLPSSQYIMLDDTDFELYDDSPDYFCEIWIPVKRK